MQLLKYIPLQLTLFLILGILCGFYFDPSIRVVIILLVSSLILLLVVYFATQRWNTPLIYFTSTTAITFFLIGITSIIIHNDLNAKEHYIHFISKNSADKILLNVNSILKNNDYFDSYEVEILKVNNQETVGKVLLNINKDSLQAKLNVDDRLLIETKFQIVDEPKNPYQFSYKHYLEKQQIHRRISTSYQELLVLDIEEYSLMGLAHNFRKRINESLIKYGFKGDELAIINALLLGQRQEMSKEILENYSKAGAIHILAVSGLHVGIILLIITLF